MATAQDMINAIKYGNKKFTKSDLKIGHVVKLRNDEFKIVMPVGRQGTLILAGAPGDTWHYLSSWDDMFNAYPHRFSIGCYSNEEEPNAKMFDIVAVYGFVQGSFCYNRAGDLSDEFRPLLWQRTESKRMTIAEIEEKLGYPIEIVSE